MFSRLPNALVTIVFLSSASVSNAQGTAGQTVAPPAPVETERMQLTA
jgi:hypothetical protein